MTGDKIVSVCLSIIIKTGVYINIHIFLSSGLVKHEQSVSCSSHCILMQEAPSTHHTGLSG
jgi:hypothetical protein